LFIHIAIMAATSRSMVFLCSSTRHAFFTAAQSRTSYLPAVARLRTSRSYTTPSEPPKANTSAKRAPKIVRGASKLFKNADEAVADLKSGSVILSSGFGLCGTAETLIDAIEKRGVDSLHSLTAVSNNAGASGFGLSKLTRSGQVDRLIISFLGNNKQLEQKYLSGNIAIELCPQGTLAERIRAAGAGIPAFFTPTGVSKLGYFSFGL
jgi:3-oxoacid CoA-transferase